MDGIESAEFYVYPVAGMETVGNAREPKAGVVPLARLRVMVMPEVVLTLGCWIVQHPLKAATNVQFPFPNPIPAVEWANRVFRQACVVFKRLPLDELDDGSDGITIVGSSVYIDVPYDHAPPNNNLDFVDNGNSNKISPEMFTIDTALPKRAEVNLVWVRLTNARHKTHRVDPVSFLQTFVLERKDPPPLKALPLVQFYLECAHEIGHQLAISTRGPEGIEGIGHDEGKFPYPVPSEKVGLMKDSENRHRMGWLRHEDWEAAARKAKAIKANPGIDWVASPADP